MNMVARPIRAILAIAVLSIVSFMVLAWLLDYRGGDDGEISDVPGVESTETVVPEGEEPAPAEDDNGDATSATTVIVLVNGLNFRKAPSGGAELIKGLAEGAKLEHISTENGWYKVKDAEGNIGYVSASSQYTRLEE